MTDLFQNPENRIKHILSLLFLMAGLWFFALSVVFDHFGGTVYDRVVYAIGTVFAMYVFVRLIKDCSISGLVKVLKEKDTGLKGVFFRSFCFAICMLMTLYYYDSASDYGHRVALRIIMIALGMVIISLLDEEKEKPFTGKLFVIPGILWMAFGVLAPVLMKRAGALNYDAISFLAKMEIEDGTGFFWQIADFFPAAVDGKGAVPYILWGIMIIIYTDIIERMLALSSMGRLSMRLKDKPSFMAVITTIFLAGLLLFGNGRLWVIAVAVPFYILYSLPAQSKAKAVADLCRGVVLSFWIMAFTALLFRPYYSFEFVRYPGWFASVASAGLYRMLVVVSALCLILENRKDSKKAYIYKVSLGAALSTLVMGMARTSILGTGITMIAAIIIYAFANKEKGMILRTALMAAFMCIFMFPVVYTGIRCIPAIVARPVWVAHAEWFSDRIMKGEDPASSKYMNVPQLAESLLEKLAGIDINLSYMAGAESGPGNAITYDENGKRQKAPNVVGKYIDDNGQKIYVRDYEFTNDEENSGDNGRLDILRLYFDNLNATGHRSMIPDEVPEGMVLYHAHNTYMQVLFDNGILMGFIFGILCLLALIKSFLYYRKHGAADSFAIYPLCVVSCFISAAMTEWIFHPSIPIGFAFLTVLAPLTDKE